MILANAVKKWFPQELERRLRFGKMKAKSAYWLMAYASAKVNDAAGAGV
jgi:hypothetical protein